MALTQIQASLNSYSLARNLTSNTDTVRFPGSTSILAPSSRMDVSSPGSSGRTVGGAVPKLQPVSLTTTAADTIQCGKVIVQVCDLPAHTGRVFPDQGAGAVASAQRPSAGQSPAPRARPPRPSGRLESEPPEATPTAQPRSGVSGRGPCRAGPGGLAARVQSNRKPVAVVGPTVNGYNHGVA